MLLVVFGLSVLLTGYMRRYALRTGLLDIPSARSSHAHPTPRGGGVSFVVSFYAALPMLVTSAPLRPLRLALFGGLAVALVGWLDDRYHLSVRWRLAVHGLAAAWALYWLGGLPQLALGGLKLPLGAAGYPLAWLGVVWLINLYNFMDGIDGLAAGEAVLVALAAAGMLAAAGFVPLAWVCGLLAAAVAGFWLWNWPPAKIFMGDVGSGTLGYCLAVLALASERQGALPLLGWLMLLGVFVVDATATLIARALAGEAWHTPHNTHAYQRLVKRGYSHRAVTGSLLAITALLAALAAIAWRYGGLAPLSLASLLALLALWRCVR